MKNNYGFTLIELLAIVVILGVIIAVAAPNMTKQINKKEKTDQTILDEKISNAAKIYAAKYYSEKIVNCTYTNRDNPCVAFDLNDLEQDGLINLKDKCSKKDSDGKEILKNANSRHKIRIYIKDDNIFYDFDDVDNNDMDCASSNIGN